MSPDDVPAGVPTITCHDEADIAVVGVALAEAGTSIDGIALVVDETIPAGLVEFTVPPFAPSRHFVP